MPAEPIDLFAEREALFDALNKISDSDQLRLSLLHIFEQSFADGIFFTEKLGGKRRFLQNIIDNPKLILLHPKIMQTLIEVFPEYSDFTNEADGMDGSTLIHHLKLLKTHIQERPNLIGLALKMRSLSNDKTIHDFSDEDEDGKELPAIHRQIDTYYDHFRRANPVPQVQPRNQTAEPDPRTPTERQAETYVARQLDHLRGEPTPPRYTELETIKKKALTKGLIDEIKISLEKRGLKPEDFTIEPDTNGEYKVTIVRPVAEKTEIDKNTNLKELFDLSKFEREEIELSDEINIDNNAVTSIDGQLIFGEVLKKTKKEEPPTYIISYQNRYTADYPTLPKGTMEIQNTKVLTSHGRVFFGLNQNYPDSSMVIIIENNEIRNTVEGGEIMEIDDEILVISDTIDGGSIVRFPDGKTVTTPSHWGGVLGITKTDDKYYYHLANLDQGNDSIIYFENNEWKILVTGATISPVTETPAGFIFANNLNGYSNIMKLTTDGLITIGTDFSGDEITDVFPLAGSYGCVTMSKSSGKKIVHTNNGNDIEMDHVRMFTKDGDTIIYGRAYGIGDFVYSSFNPEWHKVPGKILNFDSNEKLGNNFVQSIQIGGRECLMFTDGTLSVTYEFIDSSQPINDEIVVVEVLNHHLNHQLVRKYILKDRHGTPLTPEFEGNKLHLSIRDGYIVLALQEKDKFVVYRRKIDEKSTTTEATTDSALTPTEAKKLELLNALITGDQSDIEAYFAKDDRMKQYEDHEAATIARSASGAMQHHLDTDPTLLSGVVPAKDDQPTPELIERTMLLLFPSIKENRSWQNIQVAKQKRMEKARTKKGKERPENYFNANQEGSLIDGDPREKDPIELFKITPAPNDFIVSFVGGRYDEHDHAWHEVIIPRTKLEGARDVYEAEVLFKSHGQIVLPTVLGAEVTKAGISKRDQEKILDIDQVGLGAARVDVGSDSGKLTYTQEKSREAPAPPAPLDMSLRRYRKFLTEQSEINTAELTTDISGLHEELWAAIEPAVRNASMLERIDIITKYIRDIGYYDFDNGEIKGDKWGKGLGEKLEIMQTRLAELKLRRGAAPLRASKKQYAGVCADFTELGVALLRRAELASGVMSGFKTEGGDASTTITTSNAHSMNFVLWPTLEGGVTVIPIDVTPSGVTAEEEEYLEAIRVPDKMKNVVRQVSLYGGDKKVSASMETLETETTAKQTVRREETKNFAEKIKSIPLTTDDVERWRAFLNISRYSGLSLSDSLGTPDFNYLLDEQIKEQHRNPSTSSGDPSQAMAELVMDFRDRWQTDTPEAGPTTALLALRTLTEQAVTANILPPKYLKVLDAFDGEQSKPTDLGRLSRLFKGRPKKK